MQEQDQEQEQVLVAPFYALLFLSIYLIDAVLPCQHCHPLSLPLLQFLYETFHYFAS